MPMSGRSTRDLATTENFSRYNETHENEIEFSQVYLYILSRSDSSLREKLTISPASW